MPKYTYERPIVGKNLQGMSAGKKLLHIITGPRQVGKTTAALQIAEKWNGAVVNASADLPLPPAWSGYIPNGTELSERPHPEAIIQRSS